MPTYDYECGVCGHAIEAFQQIVDKPLRVCPRCQRATLKRLIGPGAAVIFRGPGFHATDYRCREGRGRSE